MTSILGGLPETKTGRPKAPRPPPLRATFLVPRVRRDDRHVPALQRSGRVRVVVILGEQRPPRVGRLLVPQTVEKVEALHRSEEAGERGLQYRRGDAGRRVAVERGERPTAARRAGAVVVAVTAHVVREVDHPSRRSEVELEVLRERVKGANTDVHVLDLPARIEAPHVDSGPGQLRRLTRAVVDGNREAS